MNQRLILLQDYRGQKKGQTISATGNMAHDLIESGIAKIERIQEASQDRMMKPSPKRNIRTK